MIFFFILLFLQMTLTRQDELLSVCTEEYGRKTKTTNECICISRNCLGANCNDKQGMVWYNYIDCPSCRCIPPKLHHHSKPERRNEVKNEVISPVLNVEDNRPTTLTELLLDNSQYIIGFGIGSAVIIIITLYLYLSLRLSSNDNVPPIPPIVPKIQVNSSLIVEHDLSSSSENIHSLGDTSFNPPKSNSPINSPSRTLSPTTSPSDVNSSGFKSKAWKSRE